MDTRYSHENTREYLSSRAFCHVFLALATTRFDGISDILIIRQWSINHDSFVDLWSKRGSCNPTIIVYDKVTMSKYGADPRFLHRKTVNLHHLSFKRKMEKRIIIYVNHIVLIMFSNIYLFIGQAYVTQISRRTIFYRAYEAQFCRMYDKGIEGFPPISR